MKPQWDSKIWNFCLLAIYKIKWLLHKKENTDFWYKKKLSVNSRRNQNWFTRVLLAIIYIQLIAVLIFCIRFMSNIFRFSLSQNHHSLPFQTQCLIHFVWQSPPLYPQLPISMRTEMPLGIKKFLGMNSSSFCCWINKKKEMFHFQEPLVTQKERKRLQSLLHNRNWNKVTNCYWKI